MPVLMIIGAFIISNGLMAQNGNCDFSDCPSGELYDAVQYLCANGIVEGIDGDLKPDDNITRDQLAKITLYGLYGGINNVPVDLVTDAFPSIYPDLQDATTYYYRSAKALLYLEYGDGISPFDRNRAFFDPEAPIERSYVLKVMLEAFNVPLVEGYENPFADFEPDDENYGKFWVYACEAFRKGVVQTEVFRPGDLCTRGEAFLFLYRLMTSDLITIPTPMNSMDPSVSDFFIPTNLKPEVVNMSKGLELGNFNAYKKDFFNIEGYMDLDFGVSYNSYLTEMPDEYYPIQPIDKPWSHTYSIYISNVRNEDNTVIKVVHMNDGTLQMYNYNWQDHIFVSLTEGNYYKLEAVGDELHTYKLISTNMMTFVFKGFNDVNDVFYLTQITDRHGNSITISYEPCSGHESLYRIESVTSCGRSLSFDYYNGSDKLRSVTDPIMRKVYFYYDDNGSLSSLEDAKGQTTSYEYGTNEATKGLLMSVRLPEGNKINNTYEQRKLKSTTYNDELPTTISLVQDYQNNVINSTITQPVEGRQSIENCYSMNADGRLTHFSNNTDKDVSFVYADQDHPTLASTIIDNKTNTVKNYAFSNAGAVAEEITDVGDITKMWSKTFDSNTNLITSYTNIGGGTTYYYYDDNDNMIRIEDAKGNNTVIDYNEHGRPIRVVNPLGVTTEYEYNDYGNIINASYPVLNMSKATVYDDVSRVKDVFDFSGHYIHYEYDANDNVKKVVDELGYSTNYSYDGNDNMIEIKDAKGVCKTFNYNNNDWLINKTTGGVSASFTYNIDGSVKTYTSPKGHVFNYTYDGAGALLSDGYAIREYYEDGKLYKVTKDNKSIVFEYNSWGQTTSVCYDGYSVLYSYNGVGTISSITYPGNGNKKVEYEYDELNRITQVKDWNDAIISYHYRADNQIDYYVLPNQVRAVYSYDEIGRQIGLGYYRNNGDGSAIAEYSFILDQNGKPLQELIEEPFESLPDIPSSSLIYNYNAANHHLLSAGDLSFNYDLNGNVISKTGLAFDYDDRDKLVEISGDYVASFTYDGLGNCRSVVKNGMTKKYVLDLVGGKKNLLMELDNNGDPIYYYIYGPTGLVARINANNETGYYIFDWQGNTVAMIDATSAAEVTHKYQYDESGVLLQSEEADDNHFRFGGQLGWVTEGCGLLYTKEQYYDPETDAYLNNPFTQDLGFLMNGYKGLVIRGEKRNWKLNKKSLNESITIGIDFLLSPITSNDMLNSVDKSLGRDDGLGLSWIVGQITDPTVNPEDRALLVMFSIVYIPCHIIGYSIQEYLFPKAFDRVEEWMAKIMYKNMGLDDKIRKIYYWDPAQH